MWKQRKRKKNESVIWNKRNKFGIVFAITLNRKSTKAIKIMNRKKILEVIKGLDESG